MFLSSLKWWIGIRMVPSLRRPGFSVLEDGGESMLTSQKFAHHFPHQRLIISPPIPHPQPRTPPPPPPLNNSFRVITPPPPPRNFIFSCYHCSCTIFILTSYSLYTQVMLIFILIDDQSPQQTFQLSPTL